MSEGAAGRHTTTNTETQHTHIHTKILNWRNGGHGARKKEERSRQKRDRKRVRAYLLICAKFPISYFLLGSLRKTLKP